LRRLDLKISFIKLGNGKGIIVLKSRDKVPELIDVPSDDENENSDHGGDGPEIVLEPVVVPD